MQGKDNSTQKATIAQYSAALPCGKTASLLSRPHKRTLMLLIQQAMTPEHSVAIVVNLRN